MYVYISLYIHAVRSSAPSFINHGSGFINAKDKIMPNGIARSEGVCFFSVICLGPKKILEPYVE